MDGINGNTRPPDSRWQRVARIGKNNQPKWSLFAIDGSRFGITTVVFSEPGKHGRSRLRCDCGYVFDVNTRSLRRDHVHACASCACTQAGSRKTKRLGYNVILDRELRQMWLRKLSGILSRCYNPKCKAYANYGGRGIQCYELWRHSRSLWLEYAITLSG